MTVHRFKPTWRRVDQVRRAVADLMVIPPQLLNEDDVLALRRATIALQRTVAQADRARHAAVVGRRA